MGVVYKARHVELDRLVALKMVLAGGHASPEHLARFQIEAQAVARLQHPHIVQIYEIGQQDGLPFFSLEFVDGTSLDRKIAGEPQPVRPAAALIETLARAMHSAHERGVVHRDLKPANVLIAADGTPKVTDFGLAKRLEQDSGHTHSGQVMGTPRYMAPEQARGDTEDVGPLADVYALGVILYELLTGRPPFLGASALETIQLVRNQEPVSPRQLQPKLPKDLETVCLKCLQKDPARRYPSALALADDLKRFLDGEPILARPVSPAERAWRWVRRNPRVAIPSAVAAVLFLAVPVILAVYSVRITEERNAKEREREAAVAAEGREREARRVAEKATEDEKKAREAAQEQTRLAIQAIEKMVGEFQAALRNRPGLEPLRLAFARTALDVLRPVAREFAQNKVVDRRTAGGHQQIGDIYRLLDQPKEAPEEYRRSHAIVEELARQEPSAPLSKRNLAASHTNLGEVHPLLNDTAGARDHYTRALDLRREWVGLEPDSDNARRSLANSYGHLGRVCLAQGRPAEAREFYRRAKAEWDRMPADVFKDPEATRERSGATEKLGEVSVQLGDVPAAVGYYREVLGLRQELFDRSGGKNLDLKRDLGALRIRVGDLSLLLLADPRAARDEYAKARAAFEELRKVDYPSAAVARRDVSVAAYRLGTAYRRLGEHPAADAAFRESLDLRQELAAKTTPETKPRAQTDLMLALAQCGRAADAARIADALVRLTPNDPRALYNAACCYAVCAATAPEGERAGHADRAVATLGRAAAAGWKDAQELRMNPELDAVRGHPGFAAVLGRLDPTEAPPPRAK